jgi:hypothetical protein
MLAVIAVALGVIAWIGFAWGAGSFIGHPAFRGNDDDGHVDVR